MNRSTTIRRLSRLADHLETVPRAKFDMVNWATKTVGEADCGFAGCALGYACTIPAFRRAGLKMEWDDYWDDGSGKIFGNPCFRDEYGWEADGYDAAASFFGISDYQSRRLFDPARYPTPRGGKITPKMVAKRIRKFVKHLEKEWASPTV